MQKDNEQNKLVTQQKTSSEREVEGFHFQREYSNEKIHKKQETKTVNTWICNTIECRRM